MRERLLRLIVCPACQGSFSLSVDQHRQDEIEEGTLTCARCARRYPIQRGIPRLLARVSDARTADSFGFEWSTVEVTDVEEDLVTFFRKTGLDRRIYEGMPAKEVRYPTAADFQFEPDGSFLSGKLILDAGCGMGRYLRVASRYGGELVGLDFSRSVERASGLFARTPNVHLVQGDLFMPPFRRETFDYIYSIGVIHHTPDPPAAFRSVASLCRPGGSMSVYVYPPSFWLDPIRGSVMRALRQVTTRLPHPLLYRLCERVAPPLGVAQMRLAAHPMTKLLGAPLFLVTIPRHTKRGVMVGDTFDTYSAKHIRTYSGDEVSAWFRQAGFEAVDALPYPTTVTGRRAADAT